MLCAQSLDLCIFLCKHVTRCILPVACCLYLVLKPGNLCLQLASLALGLPQSGGCVIFLSLRFRLRPSAVGIEPFAWHREQIGTCILATGRCLLT